MSMHFEEIDYRPTSIGAISLRRRYVPSLGQEIYEVILGDEHLMSSLFTASEIALANSGVAALKGEQLDIVVGGLGLGYTANAVLAHSKVASLSVIEFLEPVIEWHKDGLVPLDPPLSRDKRCQVVQGDFFELARSHEGFDKQNPFRQFDAVLVDIDHTPEWLLDQRSENFYEEDGLTLVAQHIKPGGVLGLWSDTEEDPEITARLREAFGESWSEAVTFPNPYLGNEFTQSLYFARRLT